MEAARDLERMVESDVMRESGRIPLDGGEGAGVRDVGFRDRADVFGRDSSDGYRGPGEGYEL